jgi:TonB family protein
MPPGVAGRDGVAEIRIKVLVDTTGRADMRTFKVVRSTHPTLTRSARNAVAKWKFRPAMVGGCKVPRTFNWGATAGTPRTPQKKAARG